MTDIKLKRRDKLYYARIIPTTGIYEVCELILRTIKDDWFVGVDKRDKRAYLFYYKDIGKVLFLDRSKALDKVKIAEKNKPKISAEIYYEED